MTAPALPTWAQQIIDAKRPEPKTFREAVISFAASRLPVTRIGELEQFFEENTEGYIYIIRCSDRVKIGFTNKPADRMRVLRTACPYPIEQIAVFAGNRNVEMFFHKSLESWRRHGEWFENEGDVRLLIEALEAVGKVHEQS